MRTGANSCVLFISMFLFTCVYMHACISSQVGVWRPLRALSISLWFHGNLCAVNPPFGWRGLLQTNHPALRPAARQVGSWLSLPSLTKKTLFSYATHKTATYREANPLVSVSFLLRAKEGGRNGVWISQTSRRLSS